MTANAGQLKNASKEAAFSATILPVLLSIIQFPWSL
jgi:hypothetical protein